MEDVQDDEGTRILRRAKEIIEQRGWGQKDEVLAWSPTCALVSIDSAEVELYPYISSTKVRAINMAYNRLRHVIGEEDIIHWNDTPGRTKEEVLQAFDKAIALRPPY